MNDKIYISPKLRLPCFTSLYSQDHKSISFFTHNIANLSLKSGHLFSDLTVAEYFEHIQSGNISSNWISLQHSKNQGHKSRKREKRNTNELLIELGYERNVGSFNEVV